MNQSLASYIRNVPDFPSEGIQFKDVTTLLKDPSAFRSATEQLLASVQGVAVDKVVGIESRGFIFGALLADRLEAGFVPARKAGKLPAPVATADYTLEYGVDRLAIHRDAIRPGERVLIHDDLLATGGTAQAAARVVEQLGGTIVRLSFLIELTRLGGRRLLIPHPIHSVIRYED